MPIDENFSSKYTTHDDEGKVRDEKGLLSILNLFTITHNRKLHQLRNDIEKDPKNEKFWTWN